MFTRPLSRAPLTALCIFLLAGCTGTFTPRADDLPAREARPTLLLISLDGVSPDMLGRGDSPHLDQLAREGVAAAWMNPSYPTLTFPNHYSIVTGLRPDGHGIVHNTMRDAVAGHFSLGNREAVADGRWWAGAEPLWVTAEQAGIRTGTTSWPGSEAPIQGLQPTYWSLFDYSVTMEARVARVDGWLREPADQRVGLATLYFEHVDSAGHAHGPDAPQTRESLRQVDAAVGNLVDRMRTRGQLDSVNIVVISDHGMAAVPEDQVIATGTMVDPRLAEMVTDGEVLGFAPHEGRQAEAEASLLGRHERYECWRKHELPARWHYGSHPRIPPIVCQMDVGWVALPQEKINRRPAGTRGSHGYAPEAPEMRAIFIARGPSFRRNATIPAFDNVDLYPVLASLLGVVPVAGDARPERAGNALEPTAATALLETHQRSRPRAPPTVSHRDPQQ